MPHDLEVLLVSNRGPISFVREGDDWDVARGAGGLAGALDPVARRLGDEAAWVAAATSDDDRAALAEGEVDRLPSLLGYPVLLLDIDPDTYSKYYDVVSNRMLWFANHCLWDELGIETFGAKELEAFETAYEPVNKRFAEAVLKLTNEDSIVLFQDYHLSTAPGYVRAERPKQTIFHFTHSSFCGAGGLDRLPRPIPRTVIEGMLGADLLGFHVRQWVEGFLDCCEIIGADVDREEGAVRHDGRRTWVRDYPIPVDPADLLDRAEGEDAGAWAKRFESERRGPLVVRADRTEPSKNIVRGFQAYGMLLDRRPDLASSARFIACLYPSRQSMPEYRNETDEIKAVVDEVNGRHPESIDLYLEDDFDRTIGALLLYDVLLVNPLMDGMNLVSKEGPVVNQRDGVLVLSRRAGSFQEMGECALEISDPTNVEETAQRLETALDMGADERRERAESSKKAARRSKPEDWINAQLKDLEAIRAGGGPVSEAAQ